MRAFYDAVEQANTTGALVDLQAAIVAGDAAIAALRANSDLFGAFANNLLTAVQSTAAELQRQAAFRR